MVAFVFTRLADKTGGRITPRGRFAPGYPTCIWRSCLVMKSASFRTVQPVWGKRIHVLLLYAFRQLDRYKCLSIPQRTAM